MQRIVSILVILPLSVLAVALAVANRKLVSVSLDPFSPDVPALSVTAPLFAVIFAALIIGVVLGSFVTWMRQGRFRREAKIARREHRRMGETKAAAGSSLSLPAPRS